MDRRLLLDGIRRNLDSLAGVIALAGLVWLAAGAQVISVGMAVAASMGLAELGAVFGTMTLIAPREVYLLPMSRRTIWRTRIWFGLVIVGAVQLGKLGGLIAATYWAPGRVDAGTFTLSATFDLAYAGVGAAFFPLMGQWLSLPRQKTAIGRALQPAGIAIAIVGVLSTPFLLLPLADRFPLSWSAVGLPSGTLLVSGLILGLVIYRRTPREAVPASPSATQAAFTARRPPRWTWMNTATGVRRLLLKNWMTAIAIQVTAIITVPLVWQLADAIFGDTPTTWIGSARELGLLPFIASERPFNFVMFWVLVGISSESTTSMMRHLRTLPLSTARLNGLLLELPLLTWTSGWILLALFHVLLTGTLPQVWRLPLFAGLIGGDSLLRALWLWRGPSPASIGGLMFVAGVLTYTVSRLPFAADSLFLTGGIVALVAAAGVNQLTLTRSRTVYSRQSQQAMYGVPAPPDAY